MQSPKDTIVAVSSTIVGWPCSADAPKQDLSRAIVRLSGPQALEFAAQVFNSAGTAPITEKGGSWQRHVGEVCWRRHTLQAIAYVMRSPRSYTREDVVELHVPMISWLVSSLMERIISAGARLAQAGEFTRRAFEHGRISLTQAQAIGALIASRNADEARVHAACLHSHAHNLRQQLREEIENLLSMVELGLDFSQEDVGVMSVAEIIHRLDELGAHAQALCTQETSDQDASLHKPAILNAGLPRILLMGPTNAGKSSLFNALLKRDAAIVSATRHTTRDVVEAELTFENPFVGTAALLQDSAGWGGDPKEEMNGQTASSWLQQAGWSATVDAAKSADVLLLVLDGSVPVEQNSLVFLRRVLKEAKPEIAVLAWTKADLWEGRKDALSALPVEVAESFEVSSHDGRGVESLRKFIALQVLAFGARRGDAGLAADVVALTAVRNAANALKRAGDALRSGHGEDVAAVELREALHAFWQADGILMRHDAVTEAALDKIFSRFCIGK